MKYVISATAILLANVGVFALPQGGRVEAGKGNLDNPAHIIQESQHLQTRWDSFDIAAKEQVRIEQPNAQASINIKVSNGGATNINGTLTANGRVSLENPAGIQFGENSVVNVGGLLASSANGSVTSLGQIRATEVIRFQSLSGESVVNVGGNVSAQEIIVEGNGDIIIGNSAHFTASQQVLIGGGYQGKNSHVLNSQKTDVKAAAQINAPYVIVWSDKETRFLGRIDAGRGFVEVSGKEHLIFPDISRAKAGKLLLDPASIYIAGNGESGDPQITDDGIVNVDEFSGQNFGIGVDAINNYNGDVSLAATDTLTVQAGAVINKNNGSLILSGNDFVFAGTITIGGAGNYLSLELTGRNRTLRPLHSPFTVMSDARLNTSDLRIIKNYTSKVVAINIPTFFAAAGRSVRITSPAHGQINLSNGFNLCATDGTCGDLTVNVGEVRLAGAFAANNINLTVAVGAIEFATPTVTANSIALTQVDAYAAIVPATFSTRPTLNRPVAFIGPLWGVCGTNCTDPPLVAANLVITNGNLETALLGKFAVSGSILDLGSFSLTSSGVPLVVPAGILRISSLGTISITGGLTASGLLEIFTDNMELGGTFETSTGSFRLGEGNIEANVTAVADLTFNSPVVMLAATLSLDSAGFNLTLDSIETESPSFVLSGNNITLNGALTATASITITAANDLVVNDTITAGSALALTATAGGITFASTSTAITAPSITLTQADVYAVNAPATFNNPPTLNNSTSFTGPSWGICGTNCLVFANLTITDGNLETALAGSAFTISGTTLDLGAFNLTASGMSLTIPSTITTITTTGTISITGGLTASAALNLNTSGAGTMALGGTFTAGSNALTLTSANAITVASALTISSALTMAAASLGSAGSTLSLKGVTSSSALTLLGSSVLLQSGVDVGGNALVITASVGSIAFNRNFTITGSSITLTQVGVFPDAEPTTFSVVPAIVRTGGAQVAVPWATGGTNIGADLTITDGDLEGALAGKFAVSDGRLRLGSFSLTSSVVPLVIPAGITHILSEGTISITGGLTAEGGLSLFTDTIELGGTFTTGTGGGSKDFQLNAFSGDVPLNFRAVGDLTFDAHVITGPDASSLDSMGFNLTLDSIEIATAASFVLSGNNITLNGALTTAAVITIAITITAANDLVVNDSITAGTIALTATAGGITFTGTPTITAASITLTQVNAFPNTAPANFGSTTPAVVRTSGTQQAVSWATGGTVTAGNIANTGGSANISLADEAAGAFTIVGGVLDLGAFTLNLSTSGDITLPTDLTRITGTGSITIMGASTASGTQDALTLETSGTLTLGGNFNYHSLTLEGDTLNLTSAHELGSIRFLSNNGVNLTYGTLQGTPSLAAGVLHLRVTTTGTGKRTFDGTAAPWLTNDERNTTINTGGDLELTGSFRIDSANLTFNAGGNGQLIFTGNPIIRSDNIVFSQGSTAQYPKAAPADFGRIAVTIDDTHNRVSWASGGGALLGGDVTLTGTGSAINLLDEIAAYYDITNNRLDLGDSNLTVSGNVLTSSAAITRIQTSGTISITGGLTAEGGLTFFTDTLELGGTFTAGTGSFSFGPFNSDLNVRAVADLTFNSHVIMGQAAPSLGSSGFNLTLDSIETSDALTLLGDNITLNGAVNAGANALTITASAGSITFASTSTAITASSITLTQVGAFPNTAPANFGSVTPSIARIDDIQAAVDWANVVVIGDITVDAGAANIILADELVTSAFNIVGGVLDLGTYNLSLTTTGTITLPATLRSIAGTGSITIMGSDIGSGTQEALRLEATGTLTVGGNFNYRSLILVAGTLNLTATNRLGRTTGTVTDINLTYGTLQGTPSLSFRAFVLTVTTTGTGSRTFDGTAAPWLTGGGRNLTINTEGDLELTGSFVTDGGNLTFNARGNGRIIFTGNPDLRGGDTTFSQGSTAQYPKARPANFTSNTTIDGNHNRVSWASGGGALLGGDVTITGTGSAFNVIDEIAAYYDIVGNAVDLGDSNLTVSGNALTSFFTTRFFPSITSITTTGTISITDGLTTTAALNLNAGAMVLGGDITAQALTLSSGGSTTGSIAFSTTRATTISATGSFSFEFETAATPSRQPLSITATENLELNGALAMNPGAALNLSFGGTLGGTLDLTATNLGITSTGSSAVTLPSWVFDAARQLRLNVAAITLVANEEWVAESVTFGKDTTITNTSGFFLNVPTIEAGENTLTINVRQLNFLTGAAATITAGAVSLTAVTVSGEPSDTPSLTITATTGNLTLAGGFSIGAGAMILTATQGEIVFTSNPTLTATSFSLTQGGAAFPAAKPATFSDNAGADVPPTIRYTGGLQPPVDWDDETSAEAITETDGGGYNINTLLSEGGAFAAFETTRGILDLGETDLILETDNNIAIPGRITQIRARNIIIRAGIFGRGTVATPAALNRDIEFVATEGIIFRADIQSGNKITFTGRGIAFNDKKTTRISASEIVIATTGTGFANNQNVFLEATGNITLAGDVNVGLGSLIINAGGSIVTTDTTSLTGNKISYNPAVVVRNANALTLTAYDDIYLPGINLNNGDGALSLTAGGSIVTGSARSILGTTIGFTQGQARYETGRLLLRAFTGALTIDGHIARDMITLRVSDPALLDLTDAILEGVVIGNTP